MQLSKAEQIIQVVGAVPSGRVATYGQVARLAGLPGAARLVGTTLKNLPRGSSIPWHRVINARGRISLPADGAGKLQKRRLLDEEIEFIKGRVDLKRFGWKP